MKLPCLLLALCFASAAAAHAGARKPAAAAIRFYGEGGAEGANFSQKVNLLQSGREVHMASMPLITEREIVSFHAFPAKDGSLAAYLKLDDHGTRLLEQHTMARRGSYVLVFFNGRHVADLYIDKAVRDGIAYIPSGLTAHDVSLLEIAYPPIGREGEKPAKKNIEPELGKKAKPTPTPRPEDMPRMAPPLRRQADGTLAPVPPGR